MYEGQLIICKDIIEENWLEYLAYVKKRQLEEEERNKKRQELLAQVDTPRDGMGLSNIAAKSLETADYPRYYDLGLQQFWSWYITNKVGE